jgi:uncharacterized protein YjeT (DUF2065 family)
MNTLMVIFANLGNLLILVVGLMFLLKPAFVKSLGLMITDPTGNAELRGIGGCFVGLALAVFFMMSSPVYLAAGMVFIGASLAKLVSVFVDKLPFSKILPGIIADAVIGGCLLAGTQIAMT